MSTVGTPGAIRQPPAQSGNFGQGAAYPLAYTTAGSIRLSYGRQSVEDSLRAILETVPGERPMLPDFGAAVGPFEPIDLPRAIAKFKLDVATYEPRIDTVDVTTDPGPTQAEVTMNISYSLKDEADEHVLTYPLFLGASF
jgi:phage baseplate assembly protein W